VPEPSHVEIQRFISHWSGREGGQERANFAPFLFELCDVLGVDRPEPAGASHQFNDYVFERHVERAQPDGTVQRGRIDLYKRGCFILEAKQSRLKGGKKALPEEGADLFSEGRTLNQASSGTLDHLMINARRQAEGYALALPKDHAYPLFILTCDVGRLIEVYADFSGHGRHYTPFPDASGFRIEISRLVDEPIRDRLKRIWNDPVSLDPAKQTARVTREIAGRLAEISKALEARGFEPRAVALFLMRCLFTMFVEDVQLIPKDSFKELLARCAHDPKRFPYEMDDLWKRMDRGEYSPAVGVRLLRFNGKLFKSAQALPLTKAEIILLEEAARADWRDLEPAIFGTLFEQALNPSERKRLGAHYTPRAYVERLVNATVMEPLNEDWAAAQSAAERALRAGSRSAAVREIEDFLSALSNIRVLDPACGTGNFLYVALRQMKQLEGEVIKQLQDLAGEDAASRLSEYSVRPDQFFGMEVNSRAVEIAELVLWIGYLQWHLRSRAAPPAEPILGDKDHIQEKNALLTWDDYPKKQLSRDRAGKLVSRQNADGYSEEIYVYPNARRPSWDSVDFIVGNPPFIGGKDIRARLGGEYAAALWKVHNHINPSADYVMYWWDRAAEILTRENTRLRRFGFVTTNSITQVFQRRVLERHLAGNPPVSILMAIPDHPWTKASKEAAAVRIAMTVAVAGAREGVLRKVVAEEALESDEPRITMVDKVGVINADLTIGADVTKTKALVANEGLCSPGMKLHGDGFIVGSKLATQLGLGVRPHLEEYIREYRNGRDLTGRPRDVMVIDLFGLSVEKVRTEFPEVYQHLLNTVKVQREKTYEKSPTKDAKEYVESWWIFGKPRQELRQALASIERYIVTVETTKHRVFQFLDSVITPDNMLVAVASDDAFHLGVLSSRIHVSWTLASGGTLEDRPRYSKSRCFDPFPLPEANERTRAKIRTLAEELDTTRKAALYEHSDLTLTGIYNVLEKLRDGQPLTKQEDDVKMRGRALILKDLHEQIDGVVFGAYGWPVDLSNDQIIEHLVSLNEQRATEERRGFIRWLRPDYQIDRSGPLAHRADRVQSITVRRKPDQAFPTEPREQAGSILRLLRATQKPLAATEIARSFADGESVIAEVEDILKSLRRLGDAQTFDGGRSFIGTAA